MDPMGTGNQTWLENRGFFQLYMKLSDRGFPLAMLDQQVVYPPSVAEKCHDLYPGTLTTRNIQWRFFF